MIFILYRLILCKRVNPAKSAQKVKKAITPAGDGLWSSLVCVWLHHPLHVGTRMPTLIRTRLISNDTRDIGMTGDISALLEDQICSIEVKLTRSYASAAQPSWNGGYGDGGNGGDGGTGTTRSNRATEKEEK